MNVLVEGMKMPKNCLSCPLQGDIFDCRITQKCYNAGLAKRPSDCPLKEVKQGNWIEEEGLLYPGEMDGTCSICGLITAFYNSYLYCPKCGSYMRGTQKI